MDSVIPEQKCPLCKNLAKYKGVHFGTHKYFWCPKCKDFVIALNVEQVVSELKEEIRERFSKRSSRLDDKTVLLIYGNASELKVEEQPKDKWIEYRP